MKAVRLYDKLDLRVEEIASPPPPPPGFVNLKVRAAGICGSDLHNYRTGQWISRSPSTAGHEFCGRVTAVGEGVTAFNPGDLVAVDSRVWCGACEACKSGRSNICEKLGFVGEVCDGGFADEAQIEAKLLIHHDPSLSARAAAMAEPLAVALHSVRKLAAPAGEPVLVIGCGTIGGLCALLLSKMHDGPLLLADLNSQRLESMERVTGGKGVKVSPESILAALPEKKLRYAIHATASVKALESGLNVLAGGGSFALVGITHGKIELDPNILVEREIALIGCHAFADELPDAVAMLPSLMPDLHPLCEDIASLDDFPSTYEELLKGGSTKLKSIVELEK